MKEEKTQAEESLEAFKNRICKLSYDELYDELDAAEKAESDERMDIIIEQMDKLEPIEQKKKEIKKEKENFKKALIMWPLFTVFGGLYAARQIAYFLQNKHFATNEALKSINIAEINDNLITHEQAQYLRDKYLWGYRRYAFAGIHVQHIHRKTHRAFFQQRMAVAINNYCR